MPGEPLFIHASFSNARHHTPVHSHHLLSQSDVKVKG